MKRGLIIFGLVLILVGFASAATYYVSPSGSASWSSCTNINTPCSLSTANSNAAAGDTIYMRGGTYNTAIAPSHSGTGDSTMITYKAYNSENVYFTVSTVVNIGLHNYIKVDGIKVQASAYVYQWVLIDGGDHNIIQNCNFKRATGWAGISIEVNEEQGYDGAQYNQILNNTLSYGGGDYSDGPKNIIQIWGARCSYNLIQGNYVYNGIHSGISITNRDSTGSSAQKYNIVRNNIIQGKCHKGGELWGGTTYAIWENNIVYDIGTEDNYCTYRYDAIGATASEHGLQTEGGYLIIRKNVFSNNNPTEGTAREIAVGGYVESTIPTSWTRIYNNDLYDSKNYGIAFNGEYQNDVILKNNIYYQCAVNYLLQGTNSYAINEMISGNPYWSDPSGLDFRLSNGNSPAVDNGVALTKINDGNGCTSASEDCTSLPLDDALYFVAPSSQWGVPNTIDDYIWCTGWAAPIQVKARTGNTLTLGSEPNPGWSDSDNCYLAESSTVWFYDNGPDQGAYEYTSSTGCTENWQCTSWSSWSSCVNNLQTRTRTCTDLNSCGTTASKPSESETQACNLPQELILHLPLDEGQGTTATDSSGNGNDGTLVNGPAWTTDTQTGSYALSFDGVNDYVSVPSSASLNNVNQLTLSLWVTPQMGLPNDQAVIGKPWTEGSTSAPYYQYAIEIDDSPSDDQFDCMYGDSSLTLQVFSFGPVLTSGKTYHVACVWDNTHLSGYIDGQLVSSVPLTSPLQTRSSTLRIGGDYRNPPTQYFNGILDDVRIYNYALSASEIQDLYNQGSSSGSACNSLADSNGDSSISITELINYISQWKSGSVTIGNLIDAIGKWKGGC